MVVRATKHYLYFHWFKKCADVFRQTKLQPIYSTMDPQRIIRLQKLYQNSNQKLWLRGPRSKALVYPFYALFTVSTAVPLYYTGRALFGIKAE